MSSTLALALCLAAGWARGQTVQSTGTSNDRNPPPAVVEGMLKQITTLSLQVVDTGIGNAFSSVDFMKDLMKRDKAGKPVEPDIQRLRVQYKLTMRNNNGRLELSLGRVRCYPTAEDFDAAARSTAAEIGPFVNKLKPGELGKPFYNRQVSKMVDRGFDRMIKSLPSCPGQAVPAPPPPDDEELPYLGRYYKGHRR
ncbi:MAG: hypothetical protein HZB91_00520 [Elusimicrobia bacterium]|nr:hypothetical protein [Elusimicrobiota bacterium]